MNLLFQLFLLIFNKFISVNNQIKKIIYQFY